MSYSKIKKVRIGKYDTKASKKIRELIPYCEYCLIPRNLAAHHFKGRACESTRFFLPNLIVLCPSHHTFNHEFSAHKTPEKFQRWFKKKFPDRYKLIIKKAQTMMNERQAIKEFEEVYPSRMRRNE